MKEFDRLFMCAVLFYATLYYAVLTCTTLCYKVSYSILIKCFNKICSRQRETERV